MCFIAPDASGPKLSIPIFLILTLVLTLKK